MRLKLKILRRARWDAQSIFDYILKRSPQGAANWWTAFEQAAYSTCDQLREFALAPENGIVDYELRQVVFKTARGRAYRIVFTIVANEVRILRVRGPGQPPLEADELPQNG